MAAKSTSTPATTKEHTRRKAKQVTQSPAIYLTHEMIKEREKEQAYKEWHYFLANCTEAEFNIVRHVNVLEHGGIVGLMKEIRRLLGESAAKCKVIPFPAGGRGGAHLREGI